MTNSENTEKCINCGIDTEIPIRQNIDLRYGYVEGAGQLCSECFKKIYKKVTEQNND